MCAGPIHLYLRIGCGGDGNGSRKNEQAMAALGTM
jgi:hypothetical protein